MMPLIRLQTSEPVPQEKCKELLAALSRIASETIGKPEQYVMVALASGPVLMSGREGPAAFADVRSIGGLSGNVNRQLAQKICALLDASLGIASNRVFINFTDIPASHWGWNGSTFG